RRLSRPLGSLGLRQGRPSLPPTTVLTRMNLGTLTIVPAPAPTTTGTPTRLGYLATTFASAGKKPTDVGSIPVPAGFAVQSRAAAPPASTSAFQQALSVLMQQL